MYYFILVSLYLLLLQTCNAELLSLILIHRHGDRTPITTYPNDPYACYWTQGFGVLTESGAQRMIDFGKIYRKSYGNFWPKKSDIQIKSSRVDRVIKSVQYLLDGIYSDDFLLNPIPIDSPSIDTDKMLYPISDDCPKYTAELERVFNLPETVEWFNSLKPLLSYLSKKSGKDNIKLDVNNRLEIMAFQDTFRVQRQFNLSLPTWMTDSVYDQLAIATVQDLMLMYSTPLLQRLDAGLILKEIRNQMKAIEKEKEFKKIRIFSTGHVKMIAVLMGLNVFNGIQPPYGSSIIFEFHTNSFQKYSIKSYYLNDTTTGTFHLLDLADCDQKYGCSFNTFNKLIENLIPVDWYKECNV